MISTCGIGGPARVVRPMVRAMKADQASDPEAFHGEGPVWSPAWGGLKYVDMLAGDVLTLRADGITSRMHVGSVAAALRPRRTGGAVVALERSFALAALPDLSDIRMLDPVWEDTSIRFNDGGCDPQGRFYCGSMAYDQRTGAAAMWRISADGDQLRTEQVWSDVTVSNGLAFSPDGSLAYYNDTPTRAVSVMDYDPHDGFTARRSLVRVEGGSGPDGLCVDAEGYVWTAIYGGSAVHRYCPDGHLDGTVELPVTNVSACTFGGDDLGTLYITTSRENLPEGEQPEAGALFMVRPGVHGLPVLDFAG